MEFASDNISNKKNSNSWSLLGNEGTLFKNV